MKISSLDFRTLRHAADIADAQRELVELMKQRSDRAAYRQNWATDPVIVLTVAAIAVLSMLTLSSLA
jgi:hypothetical protein